MRCRKGADYYGGLLYAISVERYENKKNHDMIMIFLWPRQESNLDLGLRKPLYYPLYYEALLFY